MCKLDKDCCQNINRKLLLTQYVGLVIIVEFKRFWIYHHFLSFSWWADHHWCNA